jgi:hypothetical protein
MFWLAAGAAEADAEEEEEEDAPWAAEATAEGAAAMEAVIARRPSIEVRR